MCRHQRFQVRTFERAHALHVLLQRWVRARRLLTPLFIANVLISVLLVAGLLVALIGCNCKHKLWLYVLWFALPIDMHLRACVRT
jgi:hypothetical protein